MDKEMIQYLKEKYKEGTKVELLDMEGEETMYPGLLGTVTAVDDIGQIHVDWENGSALALNTELDSFKVISDPEIEVLLVKPGCTPRRIKIKNNLEELQNAVGGLIEEYAPFEDDIAIICNEEGKMNGSQLNRAVVIDGEMVDIIAGDFLVVGALAEDENFSSLSENMMEKYENLFWYPERFYNTESGIKAVMYDAEL